MYEMSLLMSLLPHQWCPCWLLGRRSDCLRRG